MYPVSADCVHIMVLRGEIIALYIPIRQGGVSIHYVSVTSFLPIIWGLLPVGCLVLLAVPGPDLPPLLPGVLLTPAIPFFL